MDELLIVNKLAFNCQKAATESFKCAKFTVVHSFTSLHIKNKTKTSVSTDPMRL